MTTTTTPVIEIPEVFTDVMEMVGPDGEVWRYRYDTVDPAAIYTDRFQRPPNERWLAAREGENFKPWLLGHPVLSERAKRNKDFSAVDGQHRIELCRRQGFSRLHVIVFMDMTIEREAALFSELQRERRGITPYQRFQADLIAGDLTSRGAAAKAIDRIVISSGLKLSESSDGPGFIKCVVALERIYEENPAWLRTVLTLVQRTWRDMPSARSERLVRGVWYFLRDPRTEDFDEERFVDRLGRLTPSKLADLARQLREGNEMSGSLPGWLAEAIHNAYHSKKKR